jgi:hypothetical protein
MEKENNSNKGLVKKVLLASALALGVIAITPKTNQIGEITSTYQGYTEDDGNTYLVFDDKIRELREDDPDLVIEGNPDTLKIGEKYAVRYSVGNGRNHIPKEIKYIKNSN